MLTTNPSQSSQPTQALLRTLSECSNLRNIRIRVFPEVEEFLVALYGLFLQIYYDFLIITKQSPFFSATQ